MLNHGHGHKKRATEPAATHKSPTGAHSNFDEGTVLSAQDWVQRSNREFKEFKVDLTFKVSGACWEGVTRFRFGECGASHDIIIQIPCKKAIAWQGGGYCTIYWKTGEIDVRGDSTTLGNLAKEQIKQVVELLTGLVKEIKKPKKK